MEQSEILTKIESLCNLLDSKSCKLEDIQNMNKILTEFMIFENFKILKPLLYNSSSLKAKFYAANSLINIMTQNYLSIEISDKIEIYDYIFDYLVRLS